MLSEAHVNNDLSTTSMARWARRLRRSLLYSREMECFS